MHVYLERMLSSYSFIYKFIPFKYFKTVSPAKLFMETGSEKLKYNIAESIELQPFDLFYMYLIYWEACMIDSLIIFVTPDEQFCQIRS
jgi:hypothetical protein